jgi:hypothetical protein
MLALVCAVSNAEARQRHRVVQCVETGTVLQPVCGMGGHLNFEASSKTSRLEAARFARGQELYDAVVGIASLAFGFMPIRSDPLTDR